MDCVYSTQYCSVMFNTQILSLVGFTPMMHQRITVVTGQLVLLLSSETLEKKGLFSLQIRSILTMYPTSAEAGYGCSCVIIMSLREFKKYKEGTNHVATVSLDVVIEYTWDIL